MSHQKQLSRKASSFLNSIMRKQDKELPYWVSGEELSELISDQEQLDEIWKELEDAKMSFKTRNGMRVLLT